MGVSFDIDNASHRLQSPTGEMPFLSGVPTEEEGGQSGRKLIACGWRDCVGFIDLKDHKEERRQEGRVDKSKPLEEFLVGFCEQELGLSLVCPCVPPWCHFGVFSDVFTNVFFFFFFFGGVELG